MKRKVLACVLACAMLFLGMGYAYWTDSLQIDTTVTTGELDVKFVDLGLYGQYEDEDHWAIFDDIPPTFGFVLDQDRYADRTDSYNLVIDPEEKEEWENRIKGYTETGFDAYLVGNGTLGKDLGGADYVESTKASDKIVISITKMYPGFAQMYRSDIVNPGTLAAKLSQINITTTGSKDAIKDMIGVSFKVVREAGTPVVINLLNNIDAEDTFVVGGATFVRLSALGSNFTIDENNLLSLYPANKDMNKDEWRMDLILGLAMDPDAEGEYTTGSVAYYNADNDDADTQWENATFVVDFGWDQFNVTSPAQ